MGNNHFQVRYGLGVYTEDNMRNCFAILLGSLLAAMAWTPLPAQVVESTASYNEVPDEIVIKSETEEKLRTDRPPLKMKTDDFETIRRSLDPDRDLFLFESGDFLSMSRNYPDKLFSALIVQPWRVGFSDRTVIAFYPRRKFSEVFNKNFTEKTADGIQWTLSVTDEEGKIFH